MSDTLKPNSVNGSTIFFDKNGKDLKAGQVPAIYREVNDPTQVFADQASVITTGTDDVTTVNDARLQATFDAFMQYKDWLHNQLTPRYEPEPETDPDFMQHVVRQYALSRDFYDRISGEGIDYKTRDTIIRAYMEYNASPNEILAYQHKRAQLLDFYGLDKGDKSGWLEDISNEDLEMLWRYEAFGKAITDYKIPVEAMAQGKLDGLTPEQLNDIGKIIVANDPMYNEIYNKSAIKRGYALQQLVADYTEPFMVRYEDMTKGQIKTAVSKNMLVKYMESSKDGFFQMAGAGLGAYGRNIAAGFEKAAETAMPDPDSEEGEAARLTQFYLSSATNPFVGSLQSRTVYSALQAGYAEDTSTMYGRGILDIFENHLGEDYDVQPADLARDTAARREIEANMALAVDGLSVFLGGVGGSIMGLGMRASLLGNTGALGSFAASKVGGGIIDILGGVADNLALTSGIQGSQAYALADLENKYFGTNKSKKDAVVSGMIANFGTNLVMASMFQAPAVAGVGMDLVNSMNTCRSTIRNVNTKLNSAAALRNSVKSNSDLRYTIAEKIDSALRIQNPNGDHSIHFWGGELHDVLQEANATNILTPEQRNLFGNLEDYAQQYRDVPISIGQYAAYIDNTPLAEKLKDIARASADGYSITEAQSIFAERAEDFYYRVVHDKNFANDVGDMIIVTPERYGKYLASSMFVADRKMLSDITDQDLRDYYAVATLPIKQTLQLAIVKTEQDARVALDNLRKDLDSGKIDQETFDAKYREILNNATNAVVSLNRSAYVAQRKALHLVSKSYVDSSARPAISELNKEIADAQATLEKELKDRYDLPHDAIQKIAKYKVTTDKINELFAKFKETPDGIDGINEILNKELSPEAKALARQYIDLVRREVIGSYQDMIANPNDPKGGIDARINDIFETEPLTPADIEMRNSIAKQLAEIEPEWEPAWNKFFEDVIVPEAKTIRERIDTTVVPSDTNIPERYDIGLNEINTLFDDVLQTRHELFTTDTVNPEADKIAEQLIEEVRKQTINGLHNSIRDSDVINGADSNISPNDVMPDTTRINELIGELRKIAPEWLDGWNNRFQQIIIPSITDVINRAAAVKKIADSNLDGRLKQDLLDINERMNQAFDRDMTQRFNSLELDYDFDMASFGYIHNKEGASNLTAAEKKQLRDRLKKLEADKGKVISDITQRRRDFYDQVLGAIDGSKLESIPSDSSQSVLLNRVLSAYRKNLESVAAPYNDIITRAKSELSDINAKMPEDIAALDRTAYNVLNKLMPPDFLNEINIPIEGITPVNIPDIDAGTGAGAAVGMGTGAQDTVYNTKRVRNPDLDNPTLPEEDVATTDRAAAGEGAPQVDYAAEQRAARKYFVEGSRTLEDRVNHMMYASLATTGIDLNKSDMREVISQVSTVVSSLAERLKVPLSTFLGFAQTQTDNAASAIPTKYFPKFILRQDSRDFDTKISDKDLVSAGTFNYKDYTISLEEQSNPLYLAHECLHYQIQVMFDILNDPEIKSVADPKAFAEHKAAMDAILSEVGFDGKQWNDLTDIEKAVVHEKLVHSYLKEHALTVAENPEKLHTNNGMLTLFAKFDKAIARGFVAATKVRESNWRARVRKAVATEDANFKQEYGDYLEDGDKFLGSKVFYDYLNTLSFNDARRELDHTIRNMFSDNLLNNINPEVLEQVMPDRSNIKEQAVATFNNLNDIVTSRMNKGALEFSLYTAYRSDAINDAIARYFNEYEENSIELKYLKDKQEEAQRTVDKLAKEYAEAKKDSSDKNAKQRIQELKRNLSDAKRIAKEASTAYKQTKTRIKHDATKYRRTRENWDKEYEKQYKSSLTKFKNEKSKEYKQWQQEANVIQTLKDNNDILSRADLSENAVPPLIIERLTQMGLASDTGTVTFNQFFEIVGPQGTEVSARNMLSRLANHKDTIEAAAEDHAQSVIRSKMAQANALENLEDIAADIMAVVARDEIKILEDLLRIRADADSTNTASLATTVARQVSNDIGTISLHDLTSAKFLTFAKRCGKAALTALKNSDYKTALMHTYAKLTFLERAKKAALYNAELRDRISKVRDKIAGRKGAVDIKYEPDSFAEAMSIAQAIGISRRRDVPKLIRNIKRYNPNLSDAVTANINEMITSGKINHYTNMASADLEEALDAIESILKYSEEKQKSINAALEELKIKDVETIVNHMEKEYSSELKAPTERQSVDLPTNRPLFQRVKEMFTEAGVHSASMEFFFERVDKSFHGPWKSVFFDTMAEANQRRQADVIKYGARVKQAWEIIENESKAWKQGKGIQVYSIRGKIGDQALTTTFGGKNTSLRSDIFGIMLHMGNEDNMSRVAESLGISTTELHNHINNLSKIGVINQKMWDAVQSMWDMYAELDVRAQEVSLRMTGKRYTNIEPRSFTAFGKTYKGGYVPITVKNRIPDGISMDTISQILHESYPKNPKFTRDRVAITGDIDRSAFGAFRGLSDRLSYINTLEPAVRLSGVLSDPRVYNALNTLYEGAPELINKWLLDLAYGRPVDGAMLSTRAARIGVAAMQNVVTSFMFANLTNAVTNFVNIVQAATRVKPRYLFTNPMGMFKGKMCMEKSLFMRNRLSGLSDDLHTTLNRMYSESKIKRASSYINDHAYFLQYFVQKLIDPWVWSSKYKEVISMGKTEAEAIKAADMAVRTTQTSTSLESMSSAQRSNPFLKSILPLINYFQNTNALNRATIEVLNAKQKSQFKRLSTTLMVLMETTLIPAILTQLIMSLSSGDLIEIFTGDADSDTVDATTMDMLLAIPKQALMQKNPYMGTIANYALTSAVGGKNYGAPGTPALNTMATSADALGRTIFRVATDEDVRTSDVFAAFNSLSAVTPVAGPVTRYSQTALAVACSGDYTVEHFVALVTGKMDKDLRDALNNE